MDYNICLTVSDFDHQKIDTLKRDLRNQFKFDCWFGQKEISSSTKVHSSEKNEKELSEEIARIVFKANGKSCEIELEIKELIYPVVISFGSKDFEELTRVKNENENQESLPG